MIQLPSNVFNFLFGLLTIVVMGFVMFGGCANASANMVKTDQDDQLVVLAEQVGSAAREGFPVFTEPLGAFGESSGVYPWARDLWESRPWNDGVDVGENAFSGDNDAGGGRTDPSSGATGSGGSTGDTPPTAEPSVTYVRDTQLSRRALVEWGDTDGADFSKVYTWSKDAIDAAFVANQVDLTAQWLYDYMATFCADPYTTISTEMSAGLTSANAAVVAENARAMIEDCNPLLYEYYVLERWADLLLIPAMPDASYSGYFAGTLLTVAEKTEGPARGSNPDDQFRVTVAGYPQYGLGILEFTMTKATLTTLIGTWEDDDEVLGMTFTVSGEIVPKEPGMPVFPTEAEITPPATPTPVPQLSPTPNASTKPENLDDKCSIGVFYEWQAGDTPAAVLEEHNLSASATQHIRKFNGNSYPDLGGLSAGDDVCVGRP